MIYYPLRPPPVTSVEKGAVTWNCAKVGNMPRELIWGYHAYSDEYMSTTGEDHKTFSGIPLASVVDDAWHFALEAPAAAGHLTGDSATTCSSYDPDSPGCWCYGGPQMDCSSQSTIWADESTSLYITLSPQR